MLAEPVGAEAGCRLALPSPASTAPTHPLDLTTQVPLPDHRLHRAGLPLPDSPAPLVLSAQPNANALPSHAHLRQPLSVRTGL